MKLIDFLTIGCAEIKIDIVECENHKAVKVYHVDYSMTESGDNVYGSVYETGMSDKIVEWFGVMGATFTIFVH